jgi:hypothetical protein
MRKQGKVMSKRSAMIELHAKGEAAVQLSDDLATVLRDELGEDLDLQVFRYRALTGLETLGIAILAGVGAHVLNRLVDWLLDKAKRSKPHVVITITHIPQNLTFRIPEDRDACIRHFRSVEAGHDDGDQER